eukprot:6199443-Pleurochrysis_carterae.AAC.1
MQAQQYAWQEIEKRRRWLEASARVGRCMCSSTRKCVRASALASIRACARARVCRSVLPCHAVLIERAGMHAR